MGRKKVKLACITNNSTRRSTFEKKKMGLLKKVSELSTLCEVDACVIIYTPGKSLPDVWPSPLEAHRVLTRFKSMPERHQSIRMFNPETFLKEWIEKMDEQLMRQVKLSTEDHITQLMYEFLMGREIHDVTSEELSEIIWLVERKMEKIQEIIEDHEKVRSENEGVPSNETANIMEAMNPTFISEISYEENCP